MLKTVKKRNFNYWTYATNEQIQFDNLVKIIKLPLNDPVPESFLSDMAPLWRIQFAEIGEKTKIKVIASHSLVDGRNVFQLLELFSAYALNRELFEKSKQNRSKPLLYNFCKNDWFTKEITDKNEF